MIVYGSVLVIMMLVRRQGLLGGKAYSLHLSYFDKKKEKEYIRGDKFLPEEQG